MLFLLYDFGVGVLMSYFVLPSLSFTILIYALAD